MRKALVLAALAALGCRDGHPPAKPQAQADRRYSEQAWKAEVLDSARPVLVDFWAPWCGPCRQMDPAVEALARDYPVKKVNIDTNPQLAQRYQVSAIPLVLVFKGGRPVDRYVGVTPEATLREAMAKASRE